MFRVAVIAGTALSLTGALALPASAMSSGAEPSRQVSAAAIETRSGQPPNGWIRREVPNWIYWAPSRKWVATHNKNGIEVSSPTGDIVVSYGWAPSAYQLTTREVIDYVISNASELSNVRITKLGKVTGPPGNQKQTVSWRGERQHPLKGRQSVKGMGEVHVFTVGFGAYGFSSKGYMAPVAQWNANLSTMRTILRWIKYLPS